MIEKKHDIFEDELKKHSIFKDESKLSMDYVPFYLPHRDEELRLLSEYFKVLIETPGSMSQKVIIHGSHGTGKTAIVKLFGRMIQESAKKRSIKLKFLHLNCRVKKTEHMILKNILGAFNKAIPKRGFSSEELLQMLMEILEIEGYFLILALDNLNNGENKSVNDLLYDLTRFMDDQFNPVLRLSLIIIAKDLKFMNNLEAGVKSVLQSNFLHFQGYSKAELYDILKKRCDMAFYENVVSNEALDLIAESTSRFGDIRYALDLLWRAAKHADLKQSSKLLPEHVEQVKSHSQMNENELIASLTLYQKILLLTLVRKFQHTEKSSLTIKEVEDGFILICEEYQIKAKKAAEIWENVQVLINLGLIDAGISSFEVRGKIFFMELSRMSLEFLEKKIMTELDEFVNTEDLGFVTI